MGCWKMCEGGRARPWSFGVRPVSERRPFCATPQGRLRVSGRPARRGGSRDGAPFAGLHQLCGSMVDQLPALPGPQQDALRVAFGLSFGDAPDPFLVGLGTLSLLSEAAAERPLVCFVDDAQWLDAATRQVLGFVARRLLAESVGVIFAVREPRDEGGPTNERELVRLPELLLTGLNEDDAGALLAVIIPGRLDRLVRDRIIGETRAIRWPCWSCRGGSRQRNWRVALRCQRRRTCPLRSRATIWAASVLYRSPPSTWCSWPPPTLLETLRSCGGPLSPSVSNGGRRNPPRPTSCWRSAPVCGFAIRS